MYQSESINELATALAKAQLKIKGATKDSTNPFFKSKYADLESVWDACREPLNQNGLCVIQTTEYFDKCGVSVVTILAHSSGQWIKGILPITAIKQDPQAQGSAITYSRRYALAAIVGVTQTDDDGESAHNRVNGVPQIKTEQPGPNDGVPDDSYRITFGKFKQRTLEEVGVDELRGYVNYLEDKAKKDGKEITGQVLDFINRAAEFIGSFENSDVSL